MIYFVRHGESKANLEGVFAGPKLYAPLTVMGQEQAKLSGAQIKAQNIIINNIVVSNIERAQETAKIIAAEIGFDTNKIITDSRLAEYDMGELSGKPNAGVKSSELVSAKGAENPVEFQKKISESLEDVKKLDGNSLVVSHNGVGRMIRVTKSGSDPYDFYDLPGMPNAEFIELDI